MKITFENVTPAPLAGVLNYNVEQAAKSEIWQNEVSFESSNNYQVSAPSGKGKSTFIHLLYGLRRDYTGQIKLDNQLLSKLSSYEWAKIRQTRLSVVFQDLRLFADLTAYENIRVKAVLQKQDLKKQIDEMADYLGVSALLAKKAGLLSYGERQRIAIIRALQQPFEFLLLDEPFSHLDPANIQKACDLIQQQCQSLGASIIMTSLGYEYQMPIQQRYVL
ncbi:MAG: ATP-binding cassette domain-containing protein [Microscillaceae bacterium]|jgi:putative ABC transport system ATP-binding protein|nr:ATP-binding cassette domain-containing protein [Microscillaceae bacterium]